jgi:hypothetical protein
MAADKHSLMAWPALLLEPVAGHCHMQANTCSELQAIVKRVKGDSQAELQHEGCEPPVWRI